MPNLKDPQLKIQQLRALLQTTTKDKIVPAHTEHEHWYKMTDSNGTERLMPSVTTQIIGDKGYLRRWVIKEAYKWLKENDPNNILSDEERLEGMLNAFEVSRDHASKLGTITHNTLEKYLQLWVITNKQPKDATTFIDPKEYYQLTVSDQNKILSLVKAAEACVLDTGAIPLAAEIMVGNTVIGAAGQLDAVMFMPNGDIEIWDWKTSNFLSDDYAVQTSAYRQFLTEMVVYTDIERGMERIQSEFEIKNARVVHLKKENAQYESFLVHDPDAAFLCFDSMSQVYQYMNSSEPKLLPAIESKKIVKV